MDSISVFFSFLGGLSFFLAQSSSQIPRVRVDSRSPNFVLSVKSDCTFQVCLPMTNLYRPIAKIKYLSVSWISCLWKLASLTVTQGRIRPFLFQMFSTFLRSFSSSFLFSVSQAAWIEEAVLSLLHELNTWWLSNYRALTQAWGRIPIEANSSWLLSKLKDRTLGCVMTSFEHHPSVKTWRAKVAKMIAENESLYFDGCGAELEKRLK